MKQNTLFALLLIVAGAATLTYQGINYNTREKTVDLGALQVTTEQTKHIPIPPIVGVIALAGGIFLLVRSVRKDRS